MGTHAQILTKKIRKLKVCFKSLTLIHIFELKTQHKMKIIKIKHHFIDIPYMHT